jgi:hypothetical protein
MPVEPTPGDDRSPNSRVGPDAKQAYARPTLTTYGPALRLTMTSTGGRNDPGSSSKTRTQ